MRPVAQVTLGLRPTSNGFPFSFLSPCYSVGTSSPSPVAGTSSSYPATCSNSNPHLIFTRLYASINQRAGGSASGATGSGPTVGPFPIPPGGSNNEIPLSERERLPWRELTVGEKLGRAGRKGKDMAVVLVFGFGLVSVVGYATLTELFAPNSPTKLYNDVCDRLRADPELASIIPPPYSFNASTSSTHASRTRGRSRRVHTDHAYDSSTGRQKLTLRFFVEGKHLTMEELGRIREIGFEAFNQENTEGSLSRWWGIFKRAIPPMPFTSGEMSGPILPREPEIEEKLPEPQTLPPPWSFTGAITSFFTSVIGAFVPNFHFSNSSSSNSSDGGMTPISRKKPPFGKYQSGEVTAEFTQDDYGAFKYSALYVEIPDAQRSSWKLQILPAVGKRDDEVERVGMGRLRFWNRRKYE